MLTILQVAYPFAPVGPAAVGGAEQVLAAIDPAIEAGGHRSLVLACEGSEVTGRLFTIPPCAGPLTAARRGRTHRRYRAQLAHILATEAVDVVHYHGIDFLAYLPDGPTPALATLHLPPDWYPPTVFEQARPDTYVHCVSSSQRRAAPPSAVLLEDIPNGVDLERLRPADQRGDYALVLGRVCPEKGIHLALEAARRAGVPVIVAGQVFAYPEHVRYFREQVEPLLDDQVRFIGPVSPEDKRQLLARARCVIVPSQAPETSSLVAMEALASGAPVIAFPQGALVEVIEPGRTGYLVDDVEAMATAIRTVDRLDSRACRAAAETRFSSEVMCRRYLETYDRLAEPAPAPRAVGATPLAFDDISELGAVGALEAEWDELWRGCPDATVFQRPAWLLPWCAHLLAGTPRLVAIRRRDRLIGIAPFFVWPDGDTRVLSLMGAGVSDYLDVIAAPDERVAVTRGLTAWLRDTRDWDRCAFSELRPESPLVAVATALGLPISVVDGPACPALVLAGHERAEDAVPARSWARVAYARRRAEREGPMWVEHEAESTVEALFARLESLHAARWRGRGGGMLDDPSTRAFHRAAGRRLMSRGALMLHALRLHGEVAAVLYGFHDRRASRYYLSGFDPGQARRSPGLLVVADAIERAHARGAEVFDFLRGAERYKYRWGARDLTRLRTLTIWRGSEHAPPAEVLA